MRDILSVINKTKMKVAKAVDQLAGDLRSINKAIFDNPELCYKETFATSLITDYLESAGFKVDSIGLYLGIRAERMVQQSRSRGYVSLKVQTREDRFYLGEITQDYRDEKSKQSR